MEKTQRRIKKMSEDKHELEIKNAGTPKAFLQQIQDILRNSTEEIEYMIDSRESSPNVPGWVEEMGETKTYEMVMDLTAKNHYSTLDEQDKNMRMIKTLVNKTMLDDYLKTIMYDRIQLLEETLDSKGE